MMNAIRHRGPDFQAIRISSDRYATLGHNRLSIIDLSPAGNQPMYSQDGRYCIAFNGEIYNYKELYRHFPSYSFRSNSDTEIILAAYQKWGANCLSYFKGMFAFAIWDETERMLFCARDRFGVKPFYYHLTPQGTFYFASEIKGIHASGIPKEPNDKIWATYLVYGLYDYSCETFWKDVFSLPAGHYLEFSKEMLTINQWYDLPSIISNEFDSRKEEEIEEEYLSKLAESIQLRFRSDVPVGVNLSGGLDSSILVGLIRNSIPNSQIDAYTFATGNESYDEDKWAAQMAATAGFKHHVVNLSVSEVPELARKVQYYQDEPFGGFPTLAYSRLFQAARSNNTIVLLDGQGLDEQWAGYEYYRYVNDGQKQVVGPVQGSKQIPVKSNVLTEDFRKMAISIKAPAPFPDKLRNALFKDAFVSKIPRALRFNDRISMMHSCELREPFLDHQLFELAFQLDDSKKIRDGVHKYLLRKMSSKIIPASLQYAPKRPVQTPQREWLHADLKDWVCESIKRVERKFSNEWFQKDLLKRELEGFFNSSDIDNSFFIWQWLSIDLIFNENN